MRLFEDLKARFPRLYPLATAALAISAVAGVAVYERSAKGDCCHPGASCCHPGAACCAGHGKVAAK